MVRFSIVAMLVQLVVGSQAVAGITAVGSSSGGYSKGDVVLLITYILMALVFSFLCSVAEAVLLSITPSYIAELQGRKPKLAALLKKLKQDNVDKSLAAILTLNTIAHTVGAIGSGSKATVVFGSAWFGLFSALMTLMILFLSEIIPKTIGAMYSAVRSSLPWPILENKPEKSIKGCLIFPSSSRWPENTCSTGSSTNPATTGFRWT